MRKWTVEIVKFDSESVAKCIECNSYRDACKVERGASINLNHASYFTRIVWNPSPEALAKVKQKGGRDNKKAKLR